MMKSLLIIFCGVLVFLACKKDQVPVTACADNVSFSAEIAPLINQNCSTSGCHDAATAASGYDLSNHLSIKANADIILSVMNHSSGVSPMPQGQSKLADSLIAKFECWKANGSLDN